MSKLGIALIGAGFIADYHLCRRGGERQGRPVFGEKSPHINLAAFARKSAAQDPSCPTHGRGLCM